MPQSDKTYDFSALYICVRDRYVDEYWHAERRRLSWSPELSVRKRLAVSKWMSLLDWRAFAIEHPINATTNIISVVGSGAAAFALALKPVPSVWSKFARQVS